MQLGVRPSRMILRGAMGRCPVCGQRRLFRRWFSMLERCPTCSLRFERVEGHWIGAIGINTTVVLAAMLGVLMAVTLISFPDPPDRTLLVAELGIGIIGPLVFFPGSRMLWTALDLLMRPLRFGEVDPRLVVVDPYRDRPGAP